MEGSSGRKEERKRTEVAEGRKKNRRDDVIYLGSAS